MESSTSAGCESWDVVCLVETWNSPDDFLPCEDFDVFECRRKASANFRYYGGVSALIRIGVFNLCRRLESESENLLWLLLSVKNIHLVVCVVYLPPISSSSYSREDTWILMENETQK